MLTIFVHISIGGFDMYSEKCPRCWGIIEYEEHRESVKCPYCGDTVLIADFVSKRVELEESKRKNEQAEIELEEKNEQLEELNKQKERLQAQLNNSHSALSAILSSQEESTEKLGEMLTAMVLEKSEHQAMTELLHAVRTEQKSGQDTLAHLLQVLTRAHDSTEDKLNVLKETAGKILNAQNNIQDVIMLQQEIMLQLHDLKLDGTEQVTLLRDFFNWSSSVREEDVGRLQQIQKSAEALRESQNQLLESQNQLQKKADSILNGIEETKSSVDAFRQAWDTAKLDKLNMLYKEANDHMFDRNFDKAEKSFRKILVEGGEDAEVYWRLLLCHYCVEYQKDEENQYIPIILNPDLSDPDIMSDRKNLFSNAKTKDKQKEYKRKVDEIDSILNKYREVRHLVEYDVFISVKQNYNGHYTEDSDKASDLYDELCKMGLKVFNSRRTHIPPGEEYEPYIISALMSSKVMIVVGSCVEFLKAQWVQNEWSRFQWIQRYEKATKGSTERILFCYLTGGMRSEEIPRALNPTHQAIKEGPSTLGYIEDSLKRVFPEKFKAKSDSPKPQNDLKQILSQMEFWLAMEQYEEVRQKHSNLTSSGRYLDVAIIHLYALCAKLKISEIEQLKNTDVNLEKEGLFKFAMRQNQDAELRIRMEEWLSVNRSKRTGKLTKDETKIYSDGRIYKDKITDGSGTITWPNGDCYEGDIIHGARCGKGTFVWSNGDLYIGEWKDDKKHGKGTLVQDDDVQEGEWINDVLNVVNNRIYGKQGDNPDIDNAQSEIEQLEKYVWVPSYPDGRVYEDKITEGYGIITWPNGDRYEGNLWNGERSGNGTLTMADGCTYTGLWKGDKKNFRGVYTWPDGQCYDGDFLNDKRHGHGIMTWPKGARYDGGWENNVRHGKAVFREQSGNEYNTVWEKGRLVSYANLKPVSQYQDGRVYKNNITEGAGVITWPDGSQYVGNILHGVRSGKGRMRFPSGNEYTGDWLNDKAHGRGVYVWSSGNRYEGDYRNGLREGKGKYQFADGRVYDGEWKDSKRHGNGILTWQNGDQYKGQWGNDQRNGNGILSYADGRMYDGEWKDGKRHGKGIFTWPNGARYDGEWQNDMRCGKAIYTDYSGKVFDTEWRDDKKVSSSNWKPDFQLNAYKDGRVFKNNIMDGSGVITWPSGDQYVGNILHGARSGKGMQRLADGREYTGDWLEDQFNGYGVYTWPDGERFEGTWRNGTRNGRGKVMTADGRVYDGEWKDNKKHGHGVFTWPNGECYDGEWKNDVRNGRGKTVLSDGRMYDGEWKDNKKNGKGVFTWPNGERYDGGWLDDHFSGKGVYTWSGGECYDGEWKNSRRNGRGKILMSDGRMYNGEWKDNKKHGHGVFTWPNGECYDGEWQNDLRHGKAIVTDCSGKQFDTQWQNDKKTSSVGLNSVKENHAFDEALIIFIRALGNKPIQSEQLRAFCSVCDAYTQWNISYLEAEKRLDEAYKACGISQQEIVSSKQNKAKYHIDSYETYLLNLEAHYRSLKQERMTRTQIQAFISSYGLEKNYKIDVATVEKDLQDIYEKKNGVLKDIPKKTVPTPNPTNKQGVQKAANPANTWSYEEAMKAFIYALGNKVIQNEQLQAFYRVCDAYTRWNISLPEAEKRLERIYSACGIKSSGMKNGIFRSKYRIDSYEKYLLNLKAHYHSLNKKKLTDQQIQAFISCYDLDKKLKIDVQTVKEDLKEVYANNN